jgi:signal transduction histidine kinase
VTEGAKEQGQGFDRKGRRAASRLAWSLVALSVTLLLGGIALAQTTRSTAVELPYGSVGDADSVVLALATVLTFSVVGAIVASRHPRNTIGWILCSIGLVEALGMLANGYAEVWLASGWGSRNLGETAAWFASWWWTLVVVVPTTFLLLLFPDGRLPSPRWRPVAWLAGLGMSSIVLGYALNPGPLGDFPQVVNPYGVDSPVVGVLGVVGDVVAFSSMVASAASVIVRLRHAGRVDRQQIKWLGYGGAVMVGAIFVGGGIAIWSDTIGIALINIALLGLPICMGIAIVRHRLYDIDLLINRTLVYGALTGSVAGIYVLVVGYLGALFQSGGNLLISLLATGVVALLFQPLRDRLQRAVNRLIYGERDDPYAVVSRLGERLEATLAPEDVLSTIVQTVREALKLPYAAIALPRDPNGFEVVATSGEEPPADPLVLPLSYGGESVGELLLTPRAPGESFSAADRRLLDGLAHHAGVAVHGVRVMADLRRSRERLVLAREEERRRLRRDLHDELAPTLAALGLSAATVGELIPTDPKGAAFANEKLQTVIRATVGDVRRLVYDLRPPALDELGLIEAIRERASRYGAGAEGFRVTVEAPDKLPLLPAAVEVAAYRIVQEALTNVSRHARASSCTVRLACTESPSRALTIEVTDDGVGLPDTPEGGVGLSSMRERAAELGGECEIVRSWPSGTRVFARLPIRGPLLEGRKE